MADVQWDDYVAAQIDAIETIRGLLTGTPVGSTGIVAVAWCLVLTATGYLWSRRLYERIPAS